MEPMSRFSVPLVIFLSVCASNYNQSGAWYAEAVDRAVIRKLEKIKTLHGFKTSADWSQGEVCNG